MWGETITFGIAHSGSSSGSGSSSKTSSAAPAIAPRLERPRAAPAGPPCSRGRRSRTAPPAASPRRPRGRTGDGSRPSRQRVDHVVRRSDRVGERARCRRSRRTTSSPGRGRASDAADVHPERRAVAGRSRGRSGRPRPRAPACAPSRSVSRCCHSRRVCRSNTPPRPFANASISPRTYSAIASSNTPRAFVSTTWLAASSGNSSLSTPADADWIHRSSVGAPPGPGEQGAPRLPGEQDVRAFERARERRHVVGERELDRVRDRADAGGRVLGGRAHDHHAGAGAHSGRRLEKPVSSGCQLATASSPTRQHR